MKDQARAVVHRPKESALDGRYRLEMEIGSGGLGVVYRATHEKLDRLVAVKLLHSHCGENEVMRGRFEREARALATLEHPNIVAVTDFGIADDTPYLVMELLEGQTLSERLAYGPLDQEGVELLAAELLRALAFVHGRGMVHRDVKPGNVFLQRLPDGGERLKVLDFGLAKLVAPFADNPEPTLTRAGSVVGTPAYMSPEQASGEAADARSDVYATGVIIMQMVAGRLPFVGDAIEQLRSHLIAPVPALAALSASRSATSEFDAFIQRAMAKRREDRFANAGEMLTALEALPRPWFTAKHGADAKQLGLAKTLLATEPVTVPMSGPHPEAANLQHSAAREVPKPKRRGWFGSMFMFVVLPAGAVLAYRTYLPPLAAYLDALTAPASPSGTAPTQKLKLPEAKLPALTPALEALAAVALGEEPSEPSAATLPTSDPAGEEPASEDSARHTQPIESESDDMPLLANAAPKPRLAPKNPWRSVPKELRGLRNSVQGGARGSDHSIAVLRRYNREHPNDVRGHLLLAGLYSNREWRADAINQYSIAYQIDPSSRGAPEMLSNLIGMVAHGFSVNDAEKFIEHAFRTEALGAIDRAIRARHDDARAVNRLTALKTRLIARARN